MATSLSNYRQLLNRRLNELSHQKQRVREEKQAAHKAADNLEALQEARQIIQEVAKTIQEQAHEQIASVVSKCLSSVFEEPYEFKIIFEKKRGRTEARMVFIRDENEVDPLTASGGGVVDIASFALRVACLVLSRPQLRRTLVLDEPFRFVSAEYRERVRVMVETLAKEMGVQFLIVTHIAELQIGKVVEL